MTPTAVLEAQMLALLAADTTTLAEATPFIEVALVKNPFAESDQLLLTDLTLADFNGSGPKHAHSAAAQVFTDPATQDTILQVDEPAGGWHWVTGSALNLPQTIYGFALLKSDGTVLHAAERLQTPVVLTATGQGVDIPEVRIRYRAGSLS